MHICIYVYIHMYICIYTYVYMYIYICIYVYIKKDSRTRTLFPPFFFYALAPRKSLSTPPFKKKKLTTLGLLCKRGGGAIGGI